MCKQALVVFIVLRPYKDNDRQQLIQVYQSAFSESPWDEYLKCSSCGVNYGRNETVTEFCKKCKDPLKTVEFWSVDEVIGDLEFALSQQDPIVTVAELDKELIGFTWGYRLPFSKFPFLEGKIEDGASYMDEIAVRGDKRRMGIGNLLCRGYLEQAKAMNIPEVSLRTDERNVASMTLFKRNGFCRIEDKDNPRGFLCDPQYPDRIYLKKRCI